MNRNHRASIALVIATSIACSLGAQAAPSIASFAAKGFPDNSDLRGRLFAYVIGASRDVALKYGEKQLQSAAGTVTVRIEDRSTDFIVEFLNANATDATQPGRGSCFIQRGSGKGNYILQARILLEDDPSCYLSLYPSGSGTRGDVVMYGAVVKKGLFFSDMIYRILFLSFSDIVDATRGSFDWGLVFKFGTKNADPDYAGELRSALASAPESSAPAPTASSAPIALGAASGRVALAAAPALPSNQADVAAKGPRPLRIQTAVDRAASVESLILDLAAAGEPLSRELSLAPDAVPAFADDRGDLMGKPAYGDFPRYDSKGLPLAALRAALFLDFQANQGSVYALVGDNLHATIVPSYDEAGRLNFAVFSGGKEANWNDLFAGRRDLKVRLVRVPAAS